MRAGRAGGGGLVAFSVASWKLGAGAGAWRGLRSSRPLSCPSRSHTGRIRRPPGSTLADLPFRMPGGKGDPGHPRAYVSALSVFCAKGYFFLVQRAFLRTNIVKKKKKKKSAEGQVKSRCASWDSDGLRPALGPWRRGWDAQVSRFVTRTQPRPQSPGPGVPRSGPACEVHLFIYPGLAFPSPPLPPPLS